MRKYKYLFISLLIVAFIAGCNQDEKENVFIQKVSVEVDRIDYGDITVTKTYSGTLEGAEQSKIYASIPERVVKIPVSEGQYIKKGQSIIELDKDGPASQYNQAFAVYQNAKDNYEKMQKLYDQKAISELSYKGAKTSYEIAKANFNAAKATVELSSPIDGVVTDIAVNLGQQVPLGEPIATIANTEKMRLTLFVGLKEVNKLTVGKSAKVFIDSNEPISATIVESSHSADPETRLFRIELEMNNLSDLLKPGMYARAGVIVDDLHDVLSIRNSAIFSEEGITKAYLVKNDTAYVRTIKIGATDGEKSEIKSGVEAGQQVVTVGISSLRDATPVIISNKDSENVSG